MSLGGLTKCLFNDPFIMLFLSATTFGLTSDQWTALGAVGTIAGSIATFLAVWAALSQVRHAYTPRIRLANALMVETDSKFKETGKDWFSISMTNIGTVTVEIHSIYWTIGYWPLDKRRIVEVFLGNSASKALPITLAPSQSYSVYLPKDDKIQIFLEDLAVWISKKTLPREYVRSFKCGFTLTCGVSPLKQVNKPFRELLFQEVQKARAANSKRDL